MLQYSLNELDKLTRRETCYKYFKYLLTPTNREYYEIIQQLKLNKMTQSDINRYYKYALDIIWTMKLNKRIKYVLDLDNSGYNNILKKFKILVKELNLQNSLQISTLYTYLLWNGYFSKNKNLIYDTGNEIRIPGAYSLDIMNGCGVCLNFSDMLNDILSECNYSSSLIINRMIKKFDPDYTPDIKQNISETNNTKVITTDYKYKTNLWNHAFNLINESGKLYIFDSTAITALKLKNKNSEN